MMDIDAVVNSKSQQQQQQGHVWVDGAKMAVQFKVDGSQMVIFWKSNYIDNST